MNDERNRDVKSSNSKIAESVNRKKYSEMKEITGVGEPFKNERSDSYTLSSELTYSPETGLPKIPASLNWNVLKKKVDLNGEAAHCYHVQLKSSTFTINFPAGLVFTFRKNLMDRAVLQDPGLIISELTDEALLEATEEIYKRVLELQVNYRNESRLLGINPTIKK